MRRNVRRSVNRAVMGRLRRIHLADAIPSALHVSVTVREVLCGLVQAIVAQENYEQELDYASQCARSTEQLLNDIEASGLKEIADELPLSFTGGKKRRSKQDRREDRLVAAVRNQHQHNQQSSNKRVRVATDGVSCLPTRLLYSIPHDPRVENIYYFYNSEGSSNDHQYQNNKNTPCEVLGLSSQSGCVVIRCLGDSEHKLHVPLASLRPPPIDDLELLHHQFRCDTVDQRPPNGVHQKYWDQRYRLLSRFDQGVRLDAESWYSITPEIVCEHVADRIATGFLRYGRSFSTTGLSSLERGGVVLDLFSGCGGNVIATAKRCSHVIAVDLDPVKVAACRHNAAVYGVQDKIDCICADAYTILRSANVRYGSQPLERAEQVMTKTKSSTSPEPSPVVSTSTARQHVRFVDDDDSENDSDENDDFENRYEPCFTSADPDFDGIKDTHGEDDEDEENSTEDIFSTSPVPHFDAVILSPPWGGPEYANVSRFDLRTMLTCGDGEELIRLAAGLCPNLVYIVPKNTPKGDLANIARGVGLPCCVEDILIHNRVKMKIAYFGDILVHK